VSQPTRTLREIQVRRMFDRLSHRYDLMNGLISFGQDLRWRRTLLKRVGLKRGARLLDVGTGTGRIPLEALKRYQPIHVTAMDFSLRMMSRGKNGTPCQGIGWCAGDALRLPFRDASFDAVTSAYLMRNVLDPGRALEEQVRVVRPGGLVGCLETSPPDRTLVYPFVLLHLRVVIPFLGRIIAREAGAYTYLPDTTQAFMTPEKLSATMRAAGLEAVRSETFMFGVMAIHVGRRPE